MKKYILSFLLVFFLSNSVFADCQNGSCLGTPFRNWNGVGSIAYSGENPFSSSFVVLLF